MVNADVSIHYVYMYVPPTSSGCQLSSCSINHLSANEKRRYIMTSSRRISTHTSRYICKGIRLMNEFMSIVAIPRVFVLVKHLSEHFTAIPFFVDALEF